MPDDVKTKPSTPRRLELSYCRRCGALRLQLAGANAPVCPACKRVLAWIYGPDARRPIEIDEGVEQ